MHLRRLGAYYARDNAKRLADYIMAVDKTLDMCYLRLSPAMILDRSFDGSLIRRHVGT